LWGSDLGGVPQWLGIALIVVPALWVGAAEVRRRCTTLTLDVRGIHLSRGVLMKRTAMIPLPRIATVDVDQGLLSRMLHIGDVTIHSNDSSADEMFPKAHEPVKLQNLISDMIQEHGTGLNQTQT
jgi:membrane protein YdbS with pleckstrin-like domain